jgi:hypothetical protein
MSKVNKYHHLYHRVNYPRENGYRMESYQLPDWIYITITTIEEENSKYLTVYSRLHLDKEVVISPTYSCNFTDDEIIKDLSSEVSSRFL